MYHGDNTRGVRLRVTSFYCRAVIKSVATVKLTDFKFFSPLALVVPLIKYCLVIVVVLPPGRAATRSRPLHQRYNGAAAAFVGTYIKQTGSHIPGTVYKVARSGSPHTVASSQSISGATHTRGRHKPPYPSHPPQAIHPLAMCFTCNTTAVVRTRRQTVNAYSGTYQQHARTTPPLVRTSKTIPSETREAHSQRWQLGECPRENLYDLSPLSKQSVRKFGAGGGDCHISRVTGAPLSSTAVLSPSTTTPTFPTLKCLFS